MISTRDAHKTIFKGVPLLGDGRSNILKKCLLMIPKDIIAINIGMFCDNKKTNEISTHMNPKIV